MNILQPLKRYSSYRKTRNELSTYTDRQLHDMGMTRDRIKEIALASVPR